MSYGTESRIGNQVLPIQNGVVLMPRYRTDVQLDRAGERLDRASTESPVTGARVDRANRRRRREISERLSFIGLDHTSCPVRDRAATSSRCAAADMVADAGTHG